MHALGKRVSLDLLKLEIFSTTTVLLVVSVKRYYKISFLIL